MLSALFPAENNAHRVSNYVNYVNFFNWSGLTFPVSLSQIRVFERNNSNVSVNVFVFEESTKEIIPVYVTKFRNRQKHVDLLLLKNENNYHYTWIKNFSALVNHRTRSHHKTYPCPYCLHPYSSETSFQNHLPDCCQHKRQKIVFPEGDRQILEFRNYQNCEKIPFILYADFESYLLPASENECIDTHIPSGFCAYTVCTESQFQTEPFIYSGKDCMKEFFEHLRREEIRIVNILQQSLRMNPLSAEEQKDYHETDICRSCGRQFTDSVVKVRHHNHMTGKFVCALCQRCNLQIYACKRKSVREKQNVTRRKIGSDNFNFIIPVVCDDED